MRVVYLTVFEPNQLHGLAMFFLNAHDLGWSIGMVFLSGESCCWYLVYKSGYLPRILGVLLLLASVSYLVDGVALSGAQRHTTPVIVVIFITVADLVFPCGC